MARHKTLGAAVAAKTKDIMKMYRYFRKDPILKDKARSLAMHDIASEKWIAERAYEEAEELLDAIEAKGVKHD